MQACFAISSSGPPFVFTAVALSAAFLRFRVSIFEARLIGALDDGSALLFQPVEQAAHRARLGSVCPVNRLGHPHPLASVSDGLKIPTFDGSKILTP